MATDRDFVGLKPSKLDVNDIIQIVSSPSCGAVSTFIGMTRDNFEEKKVIKLEYEAYEPMAVKSMLNVCAAIRAKWSGVDKIAIYHRLGEVPVGEASIVLAISSPHRKDSLEAVRYAIDAVKTSVPVWKKEVYEGEEPRWKENEECAWARNGKADPRENDADVMVDRVEVDDVCETVEVTADSANGSDESQDADSTIDPDQIQVKADDDELRRRIESFMARKREQASSANLQGLAAYTRSNQANEDDDDDGEEDEETRVCARVNAVYVRRSDSKGHVKVHRVYNQWSQQNIKSSVPVKDKNNTDDYPPALDERLSATEKILGINKPVPRDVYDRIKKIEDRLLFLESISPEYKDIWANDDCDSVKSYEINYEAKPTRKRTYSSAELDSKDQESEERLSKKIK